MTPFIRSPPMGRVEHVRVVIYWDQKEELRRCFTNHFCSKRLIGLLFRYMFLLLTLRILSLWCRDLARTGLYGTIHSSLYYGRAH